MKRQDSIPKVIHWCWFGGRELSDLALACVRSWQLHAPDFEIVRWDESTFEVGRNTFCKTAYEAGKFAFVTDYVRAWALSEFGGVYLDADVELRGPLDAFLAAEAFSGFESRGFPFTAVWGARPGHVWPRKVLDYYESGAYSTVEPANTGWVSDMLARDFAIDPQRDVLQVGKHGVVIHPSTVFCLDNFHATAVHHFAASWLDREKASNRQVTLLRRWHAATLATDTGPEVDADSLEAFLDALGLRRSIIAALQVASRKSVRLVPAVARRRIKQTLRRWSKRVRQGLRPGERLEPKAREDRGSRHGIPPRGNVWNPRAGKTGASAG